MNIFNINLSTKITLSFSLIGVLFIGMVLLSFSNGKQVIASLTLITNESTPVIGQSSTLNDLVKSTEPLTLKLLASESDNAYTKNAQALTTNQQLIAAAIEDFSRIELHGDFSFIVDNSLDKLNRSMQEMNVNTAMLIKNQASVVHSLSQSHIIIDTLNDLREKISPLFSDTLIALEDESVIAIVNEINASVISGMLVIERTANIKSLTAIAANTQQFVHWQNNHSNLLPSLIFASTDANYQHFVRELSQLTLSLLDAVEGEQGLIAIQQRKLALLEQQARDFSALQGDIKHINNLTGTLLKNAFEQNNKLATNMVTNANTQNNVGVVVGLAILLGIILLSVWMTRFINLSMKQVMDELNSLSKGVLRNITPSQSNDEFGQLNGYLIKVVNSLKETVFDIEASSKKVEVSVESVVSSSENTLTIVHQQKDELDMVATALVEMSSTANEVAQHTEKTHEAVIHAVSLAKDGRQKVQLNHKSIEQVSSQTNKTLSAITNLNNGVKSIEGIIDTITDIADQTNLLALNAAIEAARAGDQGRGFAVVADEVRTLATRTQQSTLEIQEKISAMVKDSKVAVDITIKSEQLVGESLAQAKLADEIIMSFESKMVDVQDLSYLISTAAEEQAVTVGELDRSINQIAVLADATSQKAESAKDAAILQIEIAKDLKTNVSKFVLEH